MSCVVFIIFGQFVCESVSVLHASGGVGEVIWGVSASLAQAACGRPVETTCFCNGGLSGGGAS